MACVISAMRATLASGRSTHALREPRSVMWLARARQLAKLATKGKFNTYLARRPGSQRNPLLFLLLKENSTQKRSCPPPDPFGPGTTKDAPQAQPAGKASAWQQVGSAALCCSRARGRSKPPRQRAIGPRTRRNDLPGMVLTPPWLESGYKRASGHRQTGPAADSYVARARARLFDLPAHPRRCRKPHRQTRANIPENGGLFSTRL